MSKNTTMKLSKETLEKLHRLAGEIATKKGRRVTLEEALIQLMEENEKNKAKQNSTKNLDDRKEFLTLLDQKFSGGRPEDYKEYNYDDVGKD